MAKFLFSEWKAMIIHAIILPAKQKQKEKNPNQIKKLHFRYV